MRWCLAPSRPPWRTGPGPAPDHGLLEARLARAERAMPRRNRGALARSGPNRRRRVPDAPRPPAAAEYLDRGYLVIVTGSKFFTGPAFSGALLVPAGLANAVDAIGEIAPGFREYSSRSDWPVHWRALRSRFPVRANLGQWLRWEAALEEIRGLSRRARPVSPAGPDEIRPGVERIMASSPSLRLLPPQRRPDTMASTMKNWPSRRSFRLRSGMTTASLTLAEGRTIYRALAMGAGRRRLR